MLKMNIYNLVFSLGVLVGMTSAIGYITEQGEVHISKEDQHKTVISERDKCLRHILLDPYPKGTYCNRTFDKISCWPDTPPGVTQYQPCPNYIQGFYTRANATRKCLADGTWYVSPVTNSTWSNYTKCVRRRPATSNIPQLLTVHVEYIQLMYTTGYGISLVSLIAAVFIMLKFKKLHCPRNTVHVNLFISLIFRAVLSFLKDILFVEGVGFPMDVEKTPTDTVKFIESGTHWQCKLLYTLFHYVVLANYMWILIEGLYLHTLVYVSVFSERGSIKWYYILGWCTPFVSVIPWVIVRTFLENVLCWNTNPTAGYFWIIKTPIVVSLVINFIFFINILRALFTKLHKGNSTSARRNRYRRLAKATLILIPLFGVQYIVFIGVPDNVAPTAEVVRLYFEMFFNSFQGFIVAILLCFLNQEVQMVLKKTWYRIWSKPDPLFIQQSQQLADSQNHNGSRRVHRDSKVGKIEKPVSSEASTDQANCLCKWSLDSNGKLRPTLLRDCSDKSLKGTKHLLSRRETKL